MSFCIQFVRFAYGKRVVLEVILSGQNYSKGAFSSMQPQKDPSSCWNISHPPCSISVMDLMATLHYCRCLWPQIKSWLNSHIYRSAWSSCIFSSFDPVKKNMRGFSGYPLAQQQRNYMLFYWIMLLPTSSSSGSQGQRLRTMGAKDKD